MGTPLSILDYRQPVEFRMGEVLIRSWNILSRHFLTFVLLVGIAELLPLLLTLYLRSARSSLQPSLSAVAVGAVALALLQFVLTSFAQAIVVFAAFQDLRGRPVIAGESFRRGIARLFPIAVSAILVGIVTVIGFMICVAPGLIALAAFAVVLPACVVEELGPLQSMSRSSDLTQGHWWPIIGVGAAWVLVNLAGSGAIGAVLPADSIPGQLLSWLWTVLLGSFSAVYASILYHDLRAVREGIGIDEIASVFD